MEGGKEVRIVVVCHYYKQSLSAKSSFGTGHLIRHSLHCLAKKEKEKAGIVQFVLRFNTDGSVVTWEYSASVARSELCSLIARLYLPISFGESDAFQEYITRAHNPRFIKSSRQTTARDLIRLFNDRAGQLTEVLKYVSSVALTSDIWSGKTKEDYISVVAHFVNCDWCLEKKLLGLRPIEVAHTVTLNCLHILFLLEGVQVPQYHLLNLLSLNCLHILTVTLKLSLALISIFLRGGKAITRFILSFLYLLKMY
jgi:hypothetical protein